MATITECRDTIRLKAIGACIYCGATDKLSEEHIIPFALGGKYVLPMASCTTCATITSDFERRVLRGFMRDARIACGFPTRRPKERPKHLSLQIECNGIIKHLELSPKEHPAFLQLPLLAPAGILVGRECGIGVSSYGPETIVFGKHPFDAAKNAGATSMTVTIDWDLTSFARLIAKIGYGFAVAQYGLLLRNQVDILPLILGKSDDASFWLGSSDFRLAVESRGAMHAAAVAWIPDTRDPRYCNLIARVKLFAQSGATGYEIVVARKLNTCT